MRRKSLSFLPQAERRYAALSAHDQMYKLPPSCREHAYRPEGIAVFGRKPLHPKEMPWAGISG